MSFHVTAALVSCYRVRGGGCNMSFGLGVPQPHSSISLILLWLSAVNRPARFRRGRKAGTRATPPQSGGACDLL